MAHIFIRGEKIEVSSDQELTEKLNEEGFVPYHSLQRKGKFVNKGASGLNSAYLNDEELDEFLDITLAWERKCYKQKDPNFSFDDMTRTEDSVDKPGKYIVYFKKNPEN